MLIYIILSLLLAAAEAKVLRYRVNTNEDSKSIVQPMMPLRVNLEQSLQKVPPYIQQVDKAAENKVFLPSVLPTVMCSVKENFADCSNRGITDLSQINVSITIIGLDLSYNRLTSIPELAFVKFTRLEWLNLRQNNLYSLHNDSFYNLTSLKILNLQGNNISLSEETFPVNVFQSLKRLQQLWIQNNTEKHPHDIDYPDKALSHLQSLTDLYMDGLPHKNFGEGFTKMTSLTRLTLQGDIAGFCDLKSLGDDMFNNLVGLTHLSLIFCRINGTQVSSNVFLPLTSLTYLDLSHNDALEFDYLSLALETISNYTNLKVLNITNIVNPFSRGISVTENFSKSLPRNLEILNASSNALEDLDKGMLLELPKSLKLIDVGSNKFAFLSYLKDLNALENLETLIISGGYAFSLPWYYPPDAYHPKSLKNTLLLDYEKKDYIHQPLPPKLQNLYARNAGMSNYLTKFYFNDSNSLKLLSLDSNNFPVLQGPIFGLNKLENLSLFDCRISFIYPTFFTNLTSLKFLNLSTNYFGNVAFRSNESLFKELGSLTVLDLSFTDIRYISYQAFEGLDMLEILLLQINPFSQFEVDISFMHRLQYINMSQASIVSLSSTMMNMLDTIHYNSTNFTLDVIDNTFNCFCSNLEFLKWTTTTKVLSETLQIYCTFEDGTIREFTSLTWVYKSKQRACAVNVKLFAIVISATFLLIFLIVAAMLYNFRWKLRYLYYSAVLHYRTHDTINNDLIEFQYDVFVSYAHEDNDFVVNTLYPHLESQGLKIHIHGLHFTAGEYISSNIVNAVRNSRHTLVVLTQNHLNSKWSKYEVEMANMEQVHTGRTVLLFLIMDHLPKLTTQLLFYVKNNTYIVYPKSGSNEIKRKVFWSKLVNDLKL